MAKKYPTVIIATSVGSVDVPIPPVDIRVFEAFALTLRGCVDRSRTREVLDDAHTHSSHRLERRHRRMEAEVTRVLDSLLGRLSVRAAELESILFMAAREEVPVPSSADLVALAGRDRQAWATERRRARAANATRSSGLQKAAAAATELAILREEFVGVLAEGDDIRSLWEEAFMLRNARYARARFGWGGRDPGQQPVVSGYHRVGGPYADRRPACPRNDAPGLVCRVERDLTKENQ